MHVRELVANLQLHAIVMYLWGCLILAGVVKLDEQYGIDTLLKVVGTYFSVCTLFFVGVGIYRPVFVLPLPDDHNKVGTRKRKVLEATAAVESISFSMSCIAMAVSILLCAVFPQLSEVITIFSFCTGAIFVWIINDIAIKYKSR